MAGSSIAGSGRRSALSSRYRLAGVEGLQPAGVRRDALSLPNGRQVGVESVSRCLGQHGSGGHGCGCGGHTLAVRVLAGADVSLDGSGGGAGV